VSGSRPITSQLYNLAAVKERVGLRLDGFYDEKIASAQAVDTVYAELLKEMQQFIRRGGKKLRPYLVYLGYVGYGGSDIEGIIDIGASQELLHNFLLLHDDVMDRDIERYGGLNIAGRYAEKLQHMGDDHARHHGASIAILAGDVNCGLSYELVASSGFDDDLKVQAMQRLNRAVYEVAGGQLLDISLPLEGKGVASEERIMQVYRYKTASYTFATTLQLGASMARAPQVQLDLLQQLSEPLGVAFQIIDDLISMFGDKGRGQQPDLGDLQQGKQTLLMCRAFKLADDSQRRVLERSFGNPQATAEDHTAVKAVLEETGAHAQTQAQAAHCAMEAGHVIGQLTVTPAVKEALTDLVALVVQRSR
jgi:geranylgeranyl pyrophosphate synthase